MMMIIVLLIKFIYMLAIEINQNINLKREKRSLEKLKDAKAFTENPNNMMDVYKSIEEYNQSKKCKKNYKPY